MPSARLQPSFAAGVLAPGLHGRVDLAKYDVGLKVGKNVFIHTHGGVSNRAGTEFVAAGWSANGPYSLIPFSRDEDDNYVMVMDDQEMRIVFDGAWVLDGGLPYTPSTPYAAADVTSVDYAQQIDVMFMSHPDYFPQKMSRSALTSWTFANILTNPTIAAPTGTSASSNAAGPFVYAYQVSTVDENGVEGFPSTFFSATGSENLDVLGTQISISWAAVPGAESYNVYRYKGGVFGYIGFSNGVSFTDDNISPNTEINPVQFASVFQTVDDYPSVVTMHQQRLTFGASRNDPELIIASRTGDFENFTKSRFTRASDRVQISLSGERINRVRALLPLRELLAFTWAGEFAIAGPDGGFPATNPVATQYGQAGAAPNIKPVVIDDTAIFVDRTRRGVRDLRYAFEQDGYSGNDLTIFAEHYFRGKEIVTWAYTRSPHSIVWVGLNDGTLLSFTYKREHQVWAWAEHDIGGNVIDLASIPESGDDRLYLLVERQINGSTVRYVERLREREVIDQMDSFFVDCGITYDGAATTTITGLSHLEGEAVVALADGVVVENLTVTSGEVTLPRAASKVHVGLPIESEIETLPMAIETRELGSARGRPHRTPRARVQLENTRGVEIADTRRNFRKMLQERGDLATVESLFTGMFDFSLEADWSEDGTIVIRQRAPLPMTVLGISPEVVIGRAG